MTALRRVLACGAVLALAVVAAAGSTPALADQSGTVYLATVPALGGVQLSVSGTQVTTAPDGTASVGVATINSVAHRVQLAGTGDDNGDTISLARITPGVHVPHESHLRLGLNVVSPVRIAVDSGVSGVSASAIHLVTLHSSLGKKVTVDLARTHTVHLLSRSAVLVHGVLVARRVTWSVGLVTVTAGKKLSATTSAFDPLGHPSWRMALKSVNGTAVITTVPRVANVDFQLEGATFTTDRHGVATVPVTDLNDLAGHLKLASPNAGPLQVGNLRVSSQPAKRVGQRRLVAALDVRRPVELRFVDMHGKPVPEANITKLRMSVGNTSVSLVGTEVRSSPALLTQISAQVRGAWQARPVKYTLHSVRIDGSEAVFDGRQKFSPSDGPTWTVKLAVFTLTLTVHDAIFGSQVGSHAVLVRPDRTDRNVTVLSGRPARISDVVRGLYDVRIDTAVVGGKTQVLVSRDDQIDLRIVTLLDAVIILVVGLLLLIATVFGGRAMARRRSAGSPLPSAPESDGQPESYAGAEEAYDPEKASAQRAGALP